MFIPLGDDVEKKHVPWVSIVLIVVNVLVFAYEFRLEIEDPTLETQMQLFYSWGLIAKELADGRVIGLFTSMFLHGDFFHLLGNMVVLWAFANTLENVLGSLRFGFLYLVSGLAGGLAQCIVDMQSEIPVIGASGAIAGLCGAYCLAFGPSTSIRTLIMIGKPFVVNIPTCMFALVWLFFQWLGSMLAAPGEPGVAWMAHIGGFAAGSLFMPLMNDGSRRLVRWRDGTTRVADLQPVAKQKVEIPTETVPVDCCRYCGTSLTKAVVLAPTLRKCAKPECGMLNYLTEPALAGASS